MPGAFIRGLACILCLQARLLAADPAVLRVQPERAPAIALDGELSEPAWRNAPVVRLTQQSPHPGAPTPYTTEVRVVATSDRVYFGFACHDPDPRRLSVHSLERDSEMDGDDTVSLVLDTYGDRRTGYLFRVNAAGARTDGLISNPEHASLDWDGVWDARVQRTGDGWTAEIALPTRTLSFTRGLDRWGANFERYVARERLTLRWASPVLDAFLYDLSRAGAIEGIGELEQGVGIEFSPYLMGRSATEFVRPRSWQGAGGGEFTWKVTPQFVTVATVNTDFAETEVDARQINLTRFPLFFPEKRAFFLEGANQYEFGLGLGEQFIPFFSRRIGLLAGQPVPINAGVKLNGRAGRFNLAALDVQTRETRIGDRLVPGTNLLAGRVSYDVTDKFRVGTLVTNGDPSGLGDNRLFGFDAVYRTSTLFGDKNFLVGGWTARTAGEAAPGDRQGWGFKIDYPNDLWDCAASLNRYGGALDPGLGFLPRPGTRQLHLGCDWKPRPAKDGRLGWIRQVFFENGYDRVTGENGRVESWSYFMAPVNVRLESGDRFEFNWAPTYEYLAAPFEVADGVVIPPGEYPFTRWRIEVESSEHRALQAESTTWFGSFYSGHLTQWEQSLGWTSRGGRWQARLGAENNFARLPQGNFVQRLWQLRGGYAWSPNLALTTFVQYDNESHNVGANTRLRWTIRPGNDLFLVWNRGWQRLIRDPHELNLVPDSDLIAIKLRWTFRR